LKVHGYFLVDGSEVDFTGTVAWAEAGSPMTSVFSRIGVAFDVPPKGLEPLFLQLDGRKKRVKAR
jgi:hypothetical protein